MKTGNFSPPKPRGFSLIEITITLGIATIALVSILGMLPQALRLSRDSADRTAIGALLEDVHDRVEGQPLEAGTPEISPLFYDQQGKHVDPEAEVENPLVGGPFFRVDLSLRVTDESVKPGHFRPDKEFYSMRIDVSWPLQEDREPLPDREPGVTIAYPVTTLTGPDWEAIDPEYVPKIEF